MDDPHDLVVRTIREHAPALLRTARAHSLCPDDAHDAYQRGLEIFLRRAATLDAATVDRWLHVVIKHEAQAIRQARGREVGDAAELDARMPAPDLDADERVLRFDRVSRSAEALARLKPQEVRALWLKAQGHSYAEIAESTGWTYTKVNRCLTEGRRSFLDRYASIERGEECRRWAPVVSAIVDGEATADQLAAARPHLRRCAGCRATLRELHAAGPQLAGVLPAVPLATAAGAVPDAGGLLSGLGRAVESLGVALHERANTWALKLQLAGEAASGAKVAAVAASAVAVAGGGAVTVAEVADRGERERGGRIEPVASAPERSARPLVTAPAASLQAAVGPMARTGPAFTAGAATSAAGGGERRRPEARAAAAGASAARGAPDAGGGGGEFAVEERPAPTAPTGEFTAPAPTATASSSPPPEPAATPQPAAAIVERPAPAATTAPKGGAPEFAVE